MNLLQTTADKKTYLPPSTQLMHIFIENLCGIIASIPDKKKYSSPWTETGEENMDNTPD